jgi:hypothetical protein
MLMEILSTPSRRLRATSMIAAQEGHVMPAASAITLFTCANTGAPIASIGNANKKISSCRFIFSSRSGLSLP